MARLIGFIGNRPDLGPRCIELEKEALSARVGGVGPDAGQSSDARPLGWGVGFYQSGEILLKRRPIDDQKVIHFADITQDVKSDIMLAHIRNATVGTTSTENTHPFRYRQWLFAHTGTLPAFEDLRHRLSESLPTFLLRSVRGETDSELLFHLFLSFLHDAGQLDLPAVDPPRAHAAVRSTIALVDRLCAEVGQGPSKMNLLIATPEYVLAIHCGAAMGYRVFEGKSDIERLFGEEGISRMRMPDLANCRLSLVGADFEDDRIPLGWTNVADRAMVTFTRLDEPKTEQI